MPRQIINDVIPPGGRRSVRDIPVPVRRHRWSGNDDEPTVEREAGARPPTPPSLRGGTAHRGARWLLWGVVCFALAGAATAVGFAFGGAVVKVTLKSVPVEVSTNGTASSATTTAELYLPYQPLVVEGVEQASVEPEGTRRVERKATGTIIVYNNFSSAPQRLIKNTRFETPEGKIYRIPESIVVPGQKKEQSKTIPGSTETSIFADQPGAEYNSGLTDFTVPGFKESAERYAGFYARSKTPLTGGFVGLAPFAPPEQVAAARSALRATLEEKLHAEVAQKVSADSFVFSAGYAFTAVSVSEEETEDKKIGVEERGTLTALVFSREAFARYLARRILLRYDGAPVSFEKPENLSFSFLNKADFGKGGEQNVLFGLNGKGTIVWTLDNAALAEALAGKTKDETAAVLAEYPAIERSQVIIRPFWKKAFPENAARITIEANI